MIEPTITYDDECSVIYLETPRGVHVECPPGWEEIRFPWWRRLHWWVVGLPVLRVFRKGPALV
jgi:hypothetical protein